MLPLLNACHFSYMYYPDNQLHVDDFLFLFVCFNCSTNISHSTMALGVSTLFASFTQVLLSRKIKLNLLVICPYIIKYVLNLG